MDYKATKKEIFEELIQTRFRLRDCQETYDREHRKLVEMESWVRVRDKTVESYLKAKKEIQHWITKDIANTREINRLNRELKAYESLYGKLESRKKSK
jgi:flagellar biosynthesis/type III secretory pathway ATPase